MLTVLIMIMAITMLSLGYIARSDVDLAAGQNMATRIQLDQLASSGLEHARGLILNPQDVAADYWRGDTGLQLDAGSADFYDVNVARDANDYCNYTIQCAAYRLRGGEQTGRSTLSAVLRLDPCIALWTGVATTIPGTVTIQGDVYCNGILTNEGAIEGDTFSDAVSGAGTVAGAGLSRDDLVLTWPSIDAAYTHPDYSTCSIGPGTISGSTCTPAGLWYCPGDLTLGDNVTIEGMLLVNGDLTIRGSGNCIVAARNLPALYVADDLVIDDVTSLDIEGLAMVDGDCWVGAAASDVRLLGGLFLKTSVRQTAPDSTEAHDFYMYGQPTWRPSGGRDAGGLEFDGLDDYLEDPLAGDYLNGLSAITVSVWVKSDVTFQDRGILYTRDPAFATADTCLGLRYDRTAAYSHGSSCIKASLSAGAGYTQIESTDNVQTTNWQHLVLLWSSGDSLKLYINGSYSPSAYDRGSLSGAITSVTRLTLGNGSYGNLWDGRIDELRIYNRVLDPTEITQLYMNPSGGTTAGLLARYALDQDGPNVKITANPATAAIETADAERWSPAAGAFFKSMGR